MNFKKITPIFLIITLIVSFSLVWSLILPIYEWPTDYGHHFYISMTNTDSKLYEDYFTHKGPILVFVIDLFQFFLGSTWQSSIWILLLLTLLFFASISIISYNYSNNYLVTIISLLYVIFYFRYQKSDIFVDLINIPLLLTGFLFFIKGIQKKGLKKNFYFATFFLFLSLLTRIDSAIYLIGMLFIFLSYLIKEKKYDLLDKYFLLKNLIICIITFLFFSYFYKFNLNSFVDNNISFNLIYAEHDYIKFKNLGSLYALMPSKLLAYILFLKIFFYFQKKHHFGKYFSISLIIITFFQIFILFQKYESLLLFFLIFLIEILIIYFLIFYKKKLNDYELFTVLILNFLSFFIFLYSGSLKLQHIFITLPGSLILIIYFLKNLSTSGYKFSNLILILLFSLFLYQSEKILRTTKEIYKSDNTISFKNGIDNLFYDKLLIEDNSLIQLIKKKNPPIICGGGWLHIFAQTKSNGLMFDWWIYDVRKRNTSIKNELFYENLFKKNFGEYLLINNECVENIIFNKSKEIRKILDNSLMVGEYLLFKDNYQYRKLK
jgi:hypothetical protein